MRVCESVFDCEKIILADLRAMFGSIHDSKKLTTPRTVPTTNTNIPFGLDRFVTVDRSASKQGPCWISVCTFYNASFIVVFSVGRSY